MVSKTAILFLAIHTCFTLITTITLQKVFSLTNEFNSLSSNSILLHSLLIHIKIVLACFLPLSFINYCCIPRRSRITLKRHLVTAFVIAPLSAMLLGNWMGWIEKNNGDDVLGASACYEQLDARDEMVLTKGIFCEYKFGLTRAQAESSIGVRRERLEYVASLIQICQDGLRDISHFPNSLAGVCWMGKDKHLDGDEWEEGREGEMRNGENEYFRRGFEECNAKFGLEVIVEWRDGLPVSKVKLPGYGGVKDAGRWIEVAELIDPSTSIMS